MRSGPPQVNRTGHAGTTHRARAMLHCGVTGAATLPKSQINDLLSRAESHGYISDSALRRIDIERERNGSWFGSFDGEITKLLQSLIEQIGKSKEKV